MSPVRVKAFHSSGKWDNDAGLLERNVKRTRSQGRTIGTRTEVTTRSHHAALFAPDDGWGVYHPLNPVTGTFTDCAVEWRQDTWAKVEQHLYMLNEERLHTARGFLLPPSTMPMVILRHRATGRHVVVGAFHLQLANTERRRQAWRIEAHSIRNISISLRQQHPGWEQVWQGDGNRNQRITALRDAVQVHAMQGTRLRNCWVDHLPARGGTHGPRSLLDLTLSTMRGASYLLPDDASSDHRPFATDLWLGK
jgi:hypothetical protein